jgi:hypothetical protein
MGHAHESHGPLCIQVDSEPVELKIDYGKSYEKVRLRNKYSRLHRKKLEKLRKDHNRDDKTALEELKEYSTEKINDLLIFLQKSFPLRLKKEISNEKRVRLFVASLVLLTRLKTLQNKSNYIMIDMAKRLVCTWWKNEYKFKLYLTKSSLYKMTVFNIQNILELPVNLKDSEMEIESLNEFVLRKVA